MRIGIVGSGSIGGSLGRLWAGAGHEILFSSRNPGKLEPLAASAGNGARTGTAEEAIAFADVVLEALPFAASLELPADALRGKHLISASNYYPQRDGQIDLGDLSQTELLASLLPGTRVTKAFNMMFAEEMRKRADGEPVHPLAIFFAGDDPTAKETTAQLISEARFDPVDAGALERGALFESGAALYAQKLPRDAAVSRLGEVTDGVVP